MVRIKMTFKPLAYLSFWRTLALISYTFTAVLSKTAFADGNADIWFCSPPGKGYAQLFSMPAQWAIVQKHLSVFTIQEPFVDQAGDKTLVNIFQYLNSHHIPLALEAAMLTTGGNGCGSGIEGHRTADVIPRVLRKIRNDGGDLQYIAMDEPLWFGHFARSVPGRGPTCQRSINDLADNIKTNVNQANLIFPGVRVGEELPVPNPYRNFDMPRDYTTQVQLWINAYQRETGKPLDFFHFDIGWYPSGNPELDIKEANFWPNEVKALIALAKRNHIRVGIFYTGNPQDHSGKAWIDHALQRANYVENTLGFHFDEVVFQTWMKVPSIILPENNPDAMTNLIMRYIVDRK